MKEAAHYRNVNENPCHMCMPMGGILPFKGLERSMVMIHGSQGCSTYMRRHIAEHFNEPIDVASSSLNEKGTIYGGESSLKKGLDNVIKVYSPKLIGVITTCLAETIGEDIDMIAANYLEERGLKDLPLVTVATPGYGGTHSEGYFLAVKRIVAGLARRVEKHGKINVIVPNLSPADIREIKRILELIKADYILLPDYSDTLDQPYKRHYQKMPGGGAKLNDISIMPGAKATIQFGLTVEDGLSPGRYLETEYGVPLYNLPVPMGIEGTDSFINTLAKLTNSSVPDSLKMERGRLLDCMIDSHKHNYQGRCAIFGEPEIIYAVARTCAENGLSPVVVATGSNNGKLAGLLKSLANCDNHMEMLNESDFSIIRQKCSELSVNLAIGHSDGKLLTEREGIPLVRIGFPIHDRVGGQRLLSIGYTGTTMFLDRVTNTILENKYKNYRGSMLQKFYSDQAKTLLSEVK